MSAADVYSNNTATKPIPITRPPSSRPSSSHVKRSPSTPFGGYSPTSVLSASLKATVNPLAGIGAPRMALDTPSMAGAWQAQAGSSKQPVQTPANSILLNPIRKQSSSTSHATASPSEGSSTLQAPPPLISADSSTSSSACSSMSQVAAQRSLPPAPVVTHIPAVPSEKELQRRKEKREREKQKEREERERKEREAREMQLAFELEQREEKVWGIPKKAFYMGLGSVPGAINFNAQMAMLGGWGNGSSGSSDVTNTPPRPSREQDRKRHKKEHIARMPSSSRASSSETLDHHHHHSHPHSQRRKSAESVRPSSSHRRHSSEDEEEKLDPEELAALNAIINTRRSMAAAKALASGEVKLPAPKRPVRPGLSEARADSQESMPSRTSRECSGTGGAESTHSSNKPDEASSEAGASTRPALGPKTSSCSSRLLLNDAASDMNSCCQSKVHFAPLPRPTGPLPDVLGSSPSKDTPLGGTIDFPGDADDGEYEASTASRSRRDSVESEAPGIQDDSDSDYDSDASTETDFEKLKKRLGSSKSKWYLMGLPPQAFKPDYYRNLKRWSVEAMVNGAHPAKPSSIEDGGNNGQPGDNSLGRRTSTGTLGVMSTAESERRAGGLVAEGTSGAESCASSIAGSTKRGKRGRRRSRAASLKGSSSVRSPSAGEGLDEDDRIRRRQLILASRPGGTGMVTLPDGTKVKARKVGEGQHAKDDLAYEDWGFAGLARQKAEADADADATLAESPSASPDDAEGKQLSSEQDAREGVPDGGDVDKPGGDVLTSPRIASESDSADVAAKMSALKLSAMRAEEVQRRHEEEMYALSAEVLAAHRRRQEANNTQSNSADSPHGSRVVSAEAGAMGPSASNSADAALDSKRPAREKPSFPSLRPISSAQSRRSDHGSIKAGEGRPARAESPLQQQTHPLAYSSNAQVLSSGSSLALTGSPSTSPSRNNKSASRTSLSSSLRRFRSPSANGAADSSIALPSPMSSLPRKPDARGYAVVPLPSELGVRPVRPQEGRVWSWSDDDDDDETTASDKDVFDDSSLTAANSSNAVAESDDEDEDENLDDEQLAEEDRQTAAMQAKRATTTAAGLERIRSRHGSSGGFGAASGNHLRSHSQSQRRSGDGGPGIARGRNPKRRQTTDVAALSSIDSQVVRSDDSMRGASDKTGSGSAATPTRRSRGSSMSSAHPPALSRGVVDGVHTSGSGESPIPTGKSTQASPTPKRPGGALRSTTSSPILKRKGKKGKKSSRQEPKANESTEDDDLEYWPRSASQMLGLGVGVGGASKTGLTAGPKGLFARSNSGNVQQAPTPAALLAEATRARAVRERWERERLEKERARKILEKDDDAMDYGWPPTLKGSLYDR